MCTCFRQIEILNSFKIDIAGSILCKNLIVLFSRERRFSQRHDVEDNTYTEHVADWFIFGLQIFDVDHLRSNITWSSASNEEIGIVVG